MIFDDIGAPFSQICFQIFFASPILGKECVPIEIASHASSRKIKINLSEARKKYTPENPIAKAIIELTKKGPKEIKILDHVFWGFS